MIKQLPETIKKCGCIYNLIQRVNNCAIYSLQYSKKGPIVGYDTVIIQTYTLAHYKRLAQEMGDQKTVIVEKLPSSEQYGRFGWSFNKLESAKTKLRELINVPVQKGN